MATRTTKTSTVKAKTEPTRKTSAPRTVRTRKADVVQVAVSRDEIAQRAYERYCSRGYTDGHDVEDWLAAERELGLSA